MMMIWWGVVFWKKYLNKYRKIKNIYVQGGFNIYEEKNCEYYFKCDNVFWW